VHHDKTSSASSHRKIITPSYLVNDVRRVRLPERSIVSVGHGIISLIEYGHRSGCKDNESKNLIAVAGVIGNCSILARAFKIL
jgi:hypothetical protein